MQFEYPLSDVTREELQRFQRILELNDGEIAAIEAIIIQSSSKAEYRKQQDRIRQQQTEKQQEEAVRLNKQEVERQRQQEEAEYRQKLQQMDITGIETRVVASQELIKPPIQQQSSSVQPTQPAQERITRQKFFKWAGFGSVGLVTAVVGREIFKGQSPTPQSTIIEPANQPTNQPTNKSTTISVPEPKYIPFKFETVTVNKKGQVIKREPNKQAKFFKEDLGNGITLDMVQIVEGSFNMGSPPGENGRAKNEEPQHVVNVPAFFIGKFEVTQEQYQQIMVSTPSKFKGAKRPVEQVSWNDAVEFCKKLSQKAGRNYCLPSEAEWEYACRAGTTTAFHFGETITTELANYEGDSTYASAPKGKNLQETTEVESFPPNAFGLYDMHGNVWEWCQDTWHDSYKGAPSDGSAWIDNDNKIRMLRGGSWHDLPGECRSASRNLNFRVGRDLIHSNLGFRVVVSAVGRTP
ncbi:MAG: formylglycine-generating enzyme family protein [Nostoc sp. NMS2]|nr:formylglycine-generating enzyme family protein [Nostoc sp. NMS2]